MAPVVGPIEVEGPATAWIELSPRWLAGFWGVPATGKVEVVLEEGPDGVSEQKIRVQILAPPPQNGQPSMAGKVLAGHVQTTVFGVGLEPKEDMMRRARAAKGGA